MQERWRKSCYSGFMTDSACDGPGRHVGPGWPTLMAGHDMNAAARIACGLRRMLGEGRVLDSMWSGLMAGHDMNAAARIACGVRRVLGRGQGVRLDVVWSRGWARHECRGSDRVRGASRAGRRQGG